MTANPTPRDLRDLAAHLAAVAEGDVASGRLLAPYTSYRIGGPTAIWAAPRSAQGVQRVVEAVHSAGAPLFVLGRGSNLLISDRGWPGVTLYIGENLSDIHFAGEQAEAGAGCLLMDLVHAAVEPGSILIGAPAVPRTQFWRQVVALRRLPGALDDLRAIKRRLGL